MNKYLDLPKIGDRFVKFDVFKNENFGKKYEVKDIAFNLNGNCVEIDFMSDCGTRMTYNASCFMEDLLLRKYKEIE